MADKEAAILKIVNKANGIAWDVTEGSPTHKRCAAQPKQYEILSDKPAKKGAKVDG